MRSQTFEVGGLRIHCLLGGNRSNPALVILHGWSMRASVYRSLGERLSDKHFVLIPDLPGHGRSGVMRRPDFWWMAAPLDELLEELGVTKVILVAHSMGGGVAIKWSKFRSKRVVKMILVDSTGEPVKRGLVSWALAANRKTLRSLSLTHLPGVGRIVASFTLNWLRHPLWMWRTFRLTTEVDLVGELHDVRVPTFLVWAEHDEYFPSCLRMSAALDVIPTPIAKAGHDWIILEPAEAAEVINMLLEIRI